MTGWTWLAVAVAAILFLQALRFVSGCRRAREAISRLARGDFRPVLFMYPMGVFRGLANDLRAISDALHQQHQQLAEDGFSLRGILSGMGEGVMIVDPAMRIRMINGALLRMYGLRQDPSGRPIAEVFFQPDLQRAVTECVSDSRASQIELLLVRRDADHPVEVRFDVHVAPLHAAGRDLTRGAVVVFHDITRLKKLEATRREFVANVSHEFRTPLSIISGYIETLQDGTLDDRKSSEHFLGIMQRHCSRLNLLIDDLLIISQLEHQSASLDIRRVPVGDIVAKVIENARETIEESNASVSTDIPASLPLISADPWRIEQAISNLLTNAIRYGAKDGEPPQVVLRATLEEGGVVLSVHDSGPGIPFEDQPHIFERFYRVHKDRSRNAGGTGLGLSIVRNIALAHGGDTGVISSPGEGASFWMRLPIDNSQHQFPPNPEQAPSLAATNK